MLPEGLAAGRVFRAAVLIAAVVRSEVSPQSGSGHEALATAGAIADIVADTCVRALDVVVQMRGSEERLVAVFVCTRKQPLIVV